MTAIFREIQRMIAIGTGERLDYDRTKTFVDLFREQAEKTPDNIAVVFKKKKLTYREVDSISDALARMLVREGVKEETTVGIMIDRSERMVLYPLAVMKSGGTYVPLDISYPSQRLQTMCKDSDVRIIISEGDYVTEKLHSFDGKVLNGPELNIIEDRQALPTTRPSGRFVILYTSGSTGTPKGVELEYKGIVNFCHWYVKAFDMSESDRCLAYASFSFDAHMMDIYPALSCGASVYILPSELRFDVNLLNDYMEGEGITVAFLTTQLGHLFASTIDNRNLRILLTGGEQLNDISKPGYRLVNCYGPTECTICSSAYEITKDYKCGTIGRPLCNYTVLVLDDEKQIIPQGDVGELYIAGAGLARGYVNDFNLTAERFVDCPYLKDQKMYRTGDLVRWNEDGQLEFIGRIDNQVKLRGFRIELGEVEMASAKVAGVRQAVATVKNDELCLYFTGDATEDTIRNTLSEGLAVFMVPGIYIHLDEMPLTPIGKIDRKALPEPVITEEDVMLPETAREQEIFDIVSDTLKKVQFGVTTDLISIGMSSIAAMRLSLKLQQHFGADIRMTDLMSHPTIRDLSVLIGSSSKESCQYGKVRPIQEYYPLTSNQLGIYIDWERHKEGLQYNVPFALKIKDIDAERLAEAIRLVVDAHPILKMRLAQHGGEIMQRRDDAQGAEVTLTELPFEAFKDDESLRRFFQSRVRPFDLFNDKLYRIEIYTNGSETYLFKDIHHIVTDGLSEGRLIGEIFDAYGGKEIEKEEYTFFDYAVESKEQEDGQRQKEDEEYFNELIDDTEATRYPYSKDAEGAGKSRTVSIDIQKDEIETKRREQGVTASNYILHSLMQVLRSITREERVLVAAVSNGRSHSCLQGVQGFFVKTLPVLSEASAQELQRQFITTISHEDYPLTKIVENTGIHPEILYAYEGELYAGVANEKDIESIPLSLDTPKMPLNITVNPDDKEKYTITAEYDDGLYSEKDMQMLLNCLKTMATDGRLVTEDEQSQLIALGTGERLDYDRTKTFVDLFREQAIKAPDNIAVVDKDSQITYKELDEQSNAVAQWLIDEHNIQPDDFVAVMLPRRKEFITSVLGIWKAGAAYVPIDPEYPQERKQFMIEDCEAKVVITLEELVKVQMNSVCIHVNLAKPKSQAYMIYTSGTTGVPKGVMISHSSVMNFIISTVSINALVKDDRISAHRSFSFDAHIEDIFPTLSVGASIHIMPEQIRSDVDSIRDFLEEHRITGGGYTTSIAKMLLDTYTLKQRFITCGGEALTSLKRYGTRVINVYGPTECTDHISTFTTDEKAEYDIVPIGRPLPNSMCYVVDKDGMLLPMGVAGELCYAGPQLSGGYWKQPELTAEKFVDCPYLKGQKMYRTGDLVRWNEDGQLEFIGRIDNQVKLRGFRIELGEIETASTSVEGVKQIVASVKDDTLCLYYTGDATEDSIRNELPKTLADYMVPNIFIHLDEMPLTPNGKINRKALPEPVIVSKDYVAPETVTEKMLCKLVADELKLERVGVTDSFKSYGMSSIKALRLCMVLRKKGYQVTMERLLGSDCVKKLCECISDDIDDSEVGCWLKPYEDTKATIVLFCGVIGSDLLSQKVNSWCAKYNIYIIQPLFSAWSDVEQLSFEEVLSRYISLLTKEIKAEIFCMMGFSFGGELAYSMAAKWSELTGRHPVVFMGDSYLERPFPPYDGKVILVSAKDRLVESDANEMQWKALKSDIRIVRIEDSHQGLYENEAYFTEYLNLILM